MSNYIKNNYKIYVAAKQHEEETALRREQFRAQVDRDVVQEGHRN